MADVVGMGEPLLRFTPLGHRRLEQASTFEVAVGGSELNVLISLSRLGWRAALVARLPDNDLGRLAANAARAQGVDTGPILWVDEGRMGLYFFEPGATPRLPRVLYDRAGSAMSRLGPGMVDWDRVLAGARLFHTTGITVALSPSCAAAMAEALDSARRLGVTVSFDLNYRARLWSPEEARRALEPLLARVDILFAGEEHARRVLGCRGEDAAEVARGLHARFGLRVAVVPVRVESAARYARWAALAYDGDRVWTDRVHEVEVVDRVGAGDAFAAGFLCAYLEDPADPGRALRFGNANCLLKHTVPGDYAWTTREEIAALLAGAGGPAVDR